MEALAYLGAEGPDGVLRGGMLLGGLSIALLGLNLPAQGIALAAHLGKLGVEQGVVDLPLAV